MSASTRHSTSPESSLPVRPSHPATARPDGLRRTINVYFQAHGQRFWWLNRRWQWDFWPPTTLMNGRIVPMPNYHITYQRQRHISCQAQGLVVPGNGRRVRTGGRACEQPARRATPARTDGRHGFRGGLSTAAAPRIPRRTCPGVCGTTGRSATGDSGMGPRPGGQPLIREARALSMSRYPCATTMAPSALPGSRSSSATCRR